MIYTAAMHKANPQRVAAGEWLDAHVPGWRYGSFLVIDENPVIQVWTAEYVKQPDADPMLEAVDPGELHETSRQVLVNIPFPVGLVSDPECLDAVTLDVTERFGS